MNWKKATLASLLLSFGLMGAAQAQDQDRRDQRDDQRAADTRHHEDRWTETETPYYRQWYTTTYNGREYREFTTLSPEEQKHYWEWRHARHDDDRDHHDHDNPR